MNSRQKKALTNKATQLDVKVVPADPRLKPRDGTTETIAFKTPGSRKDSFSDARWASGYLNRVSKERQ